MADAKASGDFSASETSVMDHYLRACVTAATTDEGFSVFKSDPSYAGIVQNVNISQGQDCLADVKQMSPDMLQPEWLQQFLELDLYGSPKLEKLFEDSRPALSPTVARYIKEATNMKQTFGGKVMGAATIVEIGIGYGGLRKVLHDYFLPQHYYLIDLPCVCALAKRCLAASKNGLAMLSRTTFVTTADLEQNAAPAQSLRKMLAQGAQVGPKLVISNYALSECTGAVRKNYIDEIVNRCDHVYLTVNHLEPKHRAELIGSISVPNRKITFTNDVTGKLNIVVLASPQTPTPTQTPTTTSTASSASAPAANAPTSTTAAASDAKDGKERPSAAVVQRRLISKMAGGDRAIGKK